MCGVYQFEVYLAVPGTPSSLKALKDKTNSSIFLFFFNMIEHANNLTALEITKEQMIQNTANF